MRKDNPRDSKEFIDSAKKNIICDYSQKYVGKNLSKISLGEKKQEEKKKDDELEAWCPDGECSIGFSEISESDDNFKESFHKDFGGSFETLSYDSKPPSLNSENTSSEDKRVDDFNKKYEEFMNSRK